MFLKGMYRLILCLILSNEHEVWSAKNKLMKYAKPTSSSSSSRITSRDLEAKAKKAYHDLQFEEALNYSNKAIEMNPNKVSYFVLRGRVYYQLEQNELAFADLHKAIRMEPNEKSARTLLCFMLLELGRLDEAKTHMQRLDAYRIGTIGNELYYKHRYEQAIYCYSAAIEKKPSDAWLLRLRGNCFIEMKKFEESISDLKSALLRSPLDEDIKILLIKALLLSGRIDEAQEKMVSLNHVRTVLIADTLFFERHFEEALLCYTEAIKKEPSKSWLYKYRGVCHMEMGSLDAAISDFREALRISPRFDDAKMFLCEALLLSNRIQEAKEEMRTMGDVSFTPLFKSVGRKFRLQKKFKKAIRWNSSLIETYPREPDYYIERARCYREMGNVKKAKMDCKSLLQMASLQMPHRVQLSEVLLDLEMYDVARSVIRNIDVNKLTGEDYEKLQQIYHRMEFKEDEKSSVAQPINSESPTKNTKVVRADSEASIHQTVSNNDLIPVTA